LKHNREKDIFSLLLHLLVKSKRQRQQPIIKKRFGRPSQPTTTTTTRHLLYQTKFSVHHHLINQRLLDIEQSALPYVTGMYFGTLRRQVLVVVMENQAMMVRNQSIP
jgi:hypothetical protein